MVIYMFTDTHCHLFSEYYSDIDEVIKRAKEVGVTRYISAATNYVSSLEMLDLKDKYEEINIALGLHPEDVDKEDVDKVIELIRNNKDKICAIGEIGLDYYWTKENKDKQIEVFEKQLALAEELDLPVVIHSREATLDTINTLKKYKVKGVLHCFGGSLETAREYIKMGYYIGVGGVVTFKKANLKDVIKELPMDRILLETDSPYLSPEPFRGQDNEPKNVRVIAEFIANLKEISLEEVSRITEENVNIIFKK